MPPRLPPAPSLPGVAQILASVNVLIVSEKLVFALPFQATVATLEIVPAVLAITVIVIGADVAPAAREPILQVTGPEPRQPVCDRNVAPAGMASVMITFGTLAAL